MGTGTVIIFAVAAVIVVGVFAVLISLRVRVARAAKRSRTDRQVQQSKKAALWAGALIVDSRSSAAGESTGKAHLTLTLEVSPPEGAPYRATAVWLVDMSALHLTSPGCQVPVKLIAANPQKVLPAVPWASYVSR